VEQLPEAQRSGVPALGKETWQLSAKVPKQARGSRRGGRLLKLAYGVAIVAPIAAFVASSFAFGGALEAVRRTGDLSGFGGINDAFRATLIGSCGLAGILFAASLRGIRGALTVLVVPVIWGAAAALFMFAVDENPIPTLVVFVLIQAASAEAGYFIGRFAAPPPRRAQGRR